MNQKYLPITENVRFRTYTYYSYFDAIVSNTVRTGEVAATVLVKGYDEKLWKKEEKRLHISSLEQEKLIFTAEKFNFSMEALVYRPFLLYDEQVIEIEYQQYSQPWGSIGLFISDTPSFDASEYAYHIGRFCMGDIFYKYKGKQSNYGCLGKKKSIIQIKRDKRTVFFYVYNENVGEMELLQKSECEEKDLYIGVQVSLYDNNYFDWMFGNFFQIKANTKADDVFLEFDCAFKRDWKYFTTNYFIDYNTSSISLLKKLSINICDYIKENINEEKYIEMDIDHYDIEGTKMYQKSHLKHTCLFFGYSDVSESFYLICVDDNGLIRKGRLSYRCLLEQYKMDECRETSANENMIISESYLPEKVNYSITKNDIVRYAKFFLQGESLSGGGGVLPIDNNYIYGIEIYDYFRERIDIVLKDIRVSHLLVEHKQCMVERIEYMTLKEMINESSAIQLTSLAERLLEKTKLLRNNILKNQVSCSAEFRSVVDRYLADIRDLECELMQHLTTI